MRYRKVLHGLFFIGGVTFPIYERTESSVQIGNICPKKYEEKSEEIKYQTTIKIWEVKDGRTTI